MKCLGTANLLEGGTVRGIEVRRHVAKRRSLEREVIPTHGGVAQVVRAAAS